LIDLQVERLSGRVRISFPSVAHFDVHGLGERVTVSWSPAVDDATLRHLLLDHVLPRVLSWRGAFVLHGAVVVIEGTAICLVGETGLGKSTLGASLQAAGHWLLSDDGAEITDRPLPTVKPTYPSLRLWPESVDALYDVAPPSAPMASYTSKQRLETAGGGVAAGHPLRAVVVLDPPPSEQGPVLLRPLSPREACMVLVRNSFQLDVADAARVRANLDTAARLAHAIPVFRLSYPREYGRLPEVRSALLARLASVPLRQAEGSPSRVAP
jgi:hypothetical protein